MDLLLDENIKTVFTAFNEEHFKQALERLDYVFAKYIYKVKYNKRRLGERVVMFPFFFININGACNVK